MTELLAAAIHDAKNGLNVLNTWLEEARREAPSAALDEARGVAARISSQLVELLALYRAGENSLRLAIEDHDLADFCEEVISEVILPRNSVARLSFDKVQAVKIGAWAFDAYQVKLVLQDALRNAVRHGVTQVRLEIAMSPGVGLCFTVRDDGPGFPPEVLAGKPHAMDDASSGLGLTFARLIAARHATPSGRQGSLSLSNDQGAVFALTLP